jgi:hypothetical protein
MAIRSIHCPVLGAHVTQVTDLEGAVTRTSARSTTRRTAAVA